MHVGGISYDPAKAFDCVNHELLLSKLHFYGIRNIAGQWLNHTFMTEGNMEFLNVQYLVLCFFSYISMICPQPLTLSLNLYFSLMILILLFHIQKLTVSKFA
jgi:hypothetical protein